MNKPRLVDTVSDVLAELGFKGHYHVDDKQTFGLTVSFGELEENVELRHDIALLDPASQRAQVKATLLKNPKVKKAVHFTRPLHTYLIVDPAQALEMLEATIAEARNQELKLLGVGGEEAGDRFDTEVDAWVAQAREAASAIYEEGKLRDVMKSMFEPLQSAQRFAMIDAIKRGVPMKQFVVDRAPPGVQQRRFMNALIAELKDEQSKLKLSVSEWQKQR